VIGIKLFGFRLHSYSKQFNSCSGPGPVSVLAKILNSNSCSVSWNGLFNQKCTDLFMKMNSGSGFSKNIATLYPLRIRRKSLNSGFDSTHTPVVDHLCPGTWHDRRNADCIYCIMIWHSTFIALVPSLYKYNIYSAHNRRKSTVFEDARF